MLSHHHEEKEIEHFDNVYQKLKEEIRTELQKYEEQIEHLNKEFKLQASESKEARNLIYNEYDKVTIELRQFNELAIETKLKVIDLENALKKSIDQLSQNQELQTSQCYAEGLVETLRNTICEYKQESFESKEAFLDVINQKLRRISSRSTYEEVTSIINQTFTNLFSKLHKGSHPFATLLDKNLVKLCTQPYGKFAIDSGVAFKITGGTFKARQLVWNKSEQKQFQIKWFKQESKVLENIHQKKMNDEYEYGIDDLKIKQKKVIDKIIFAQKQLSQSKQEIIKMVIKEAQSARDNFLLEAKKIMSRIDNLKCQGSDSKEEHGEIQKVIFDMTQVVEKEVKLHLEQSISKLFFQSDLLFGDLEKRFSGKVNDLNKLIEKSKTEIQEIYTKIAKTIISLDNYHAVQKSVNDSLSRIQEIQQPVLSLSGECDRIKKKLTKLIEKEFPPVLDTLKKINKVVLIIKAETLLLRQKKEANLFKSSKHEKADKIDKAVQTALQHLDIIFQKNINDEDRINDFFNFKKDQNDVSLKEVLNEKRVFYASAHMYKRIQMKVESDVLTNVKKSHP